MEPLDGDKLKMKDIEGKEIEVLAYRIANSKYNNGQCVTIQFRLDGKVHVAFTGSSVLLEQCEKYKDMIPFLATIKKIHKYYTFT